MPGSVTLKAVGLVTNPNQLDLPEGSLIEASNIIIDKDNIIQSRRGFKLYGDALPLTTDRLKQLFTYKNRILRHYSSTLQFDNGSGTFTDFSGSFMETETGLRIKSIESNNNFYFTTSEGIKKISAVDASGFTSASGYITNAGGIKAIDFNATLNVELGSQSGFLPQDSAVAYRHVWGTKDVNNNLILGTPSQRFEVYNSLQNLLLQDFSRVLGALDDIDQTGSLINDGDYVSTLNVSITASSTELQTNLIALAEKLDNDILYANDTGVGAPLNIDAASCSVLSGTATITFSAGTPSNYFSPGSKIFLDGFTPTSGIIDGANIVGTVTATTITFTTTAGNGAITVAPTATIVSNEYRNITQPSTPDVPATDDQLVEMQTYLQSIIFRLQDENTNVIPTSLSNLYIQVLDITTTANVDLTINIPSDVTLNYFLQVYRSDITQATGVAILSDLTPNDEMKLIYEAFPTQAQLDARVVTFEDVTPDIFRGANLYTNEATGEGIAQANEIPPFAKDINRFKNSVFYANTKTRQRKTMSLLGISNIVANDNFVITDGITSHTYKFVNGFKEKTDFTCVADIADSLNGKYFLINNANNVNKFYVWYKTTGGVMTDPAIAGRTGILVNINTGETATDVATKTKDKLNTYIADFLATSSTVTLTVENISVGYTDDATAGTSGFTVNIVTQGKGQLITQEITNITCVADVAGSLAGKYFTLNTANNYGLYYVWFKVAGAGIDPAPSGRIPILVDLATNDSATIVAQKIDAKINGFFETKFIATNSLGVLTVTNYDFGVADDATAGTSGFTINVTQQGAAEVLLSDSISPAISVDETAKSIVSIINKNLRSIVYAYYLSSAGSVPGKFLLETKSLGSGKFYILANNAAVGASFSPDISPTLTITGNTAANPTVVTTSIAHGLQSGDQIVIDNSNSRPSIDGLYTITRLSNTTFSIPVNVVTAGTQGSAIPATESEVSENEEKINRIYYSKTSQPEAVPLVNFFDVGAADKAILRIFPLRDSLFVFKEDGLYRISGETPPFVLALFDGSCILVASDSIGLVQNLLYCWSARGIVSVSEAGVSDPAISKPINDKILKLGSSNYENFNTATWGVGYENDNSYLVWTVDQISDEAATICYRYNTDTRSWTTFDKTNTCGIINSFDDKLYLGSGDRNSTEQERKQFSRYDYADREVDISLTAGNYFQTIMKFNSVADIEIGDVLVQTQDLTIYEFNMLLKRLDNDSTVSFNDYYSTLGAIAGQNLRNKIVDLANKLDTDPGVNDTDYASTIGNKSGTFTLIEQGDSATITTSAPHGLIDGRRIEIAGSNSSPNINGNVTVDVINSTQFTIPVQVLVNGSTGAFNTLNDDFEDIKTCYNKIIDKLNNDIGVSFSNYKPIDTQTVQEAVIVDVNKTRKEITVNLTLDYIVGPLVVFKSINSTFTYSPNTMGDPLGYKQIREATLMFQNKAFTSAILSFSTDLLPQFVEIQFEGDGNGIFGMIQNFGSNFFGGNSHSPPFRTYIPRQCQRCRYILTKFTHRIAREQYAIYGLTMVAEVGKSSRAYR